MSEPRSSRVPLEVRAEIEDLMSEFSHRVDNGLGATLHELFVEDGVIATPAFRLEGREAIRERFTARGADPNRRTRHYWTNLRLSQHGDAIHAISNVITAVNVTGQPVQLMGGSSEDIMVRTADGWAFKDRSLEIVFDGFLQSAVRA